MVQGLLLFTIVINDIDYAIVSKFVDDTKLSKDVVTEEDPEIKINFVYWLAIRKTKMWA